MKRLLLLVAIFSLQADLFASGRHPAEKRSASPNRDAEGEVIRAHDKAQLERARQLGTQENHLREVLIDLERDGGDLLLQDSANPGRLIKHPMLGFAGIRKAMRKDRALIEARAAIKQHGLEATLAMAQAAVANAEREEELALDEVETAGAATNSQETRVQKANALLRARAFCEAVQEISTVDDAASKTATGEAHAEEPQGPSVADVYARCVEVTMGGMSQAGELFGRVVRSSHVQDAKRTAGSAFLVVGGLFRQVPTVISVIRTPRVTAPPQAPSTQEASSVLTQKAEEVSFEID